MMKARLAPVYFDPGRDEQFDLQLAALQESLQDVAEFLPPVALGQPLPADADAVLFPQILGEAYRQLAHFKAIDRPILIVTSEFGTMAMWDWEIASYMRAEGVNTITPYSLEQTRKVCRALGVTPFEIGPGEPVRINPIAFGPLGQGWDRLDAAVCGGGRAYPEHRRAGASVSHAGARSSAASEAEQLGFEGGEVEDADRVVAGEESRALAGVEAEAAIGAVDGEAVVVAVQCDLAARVDQLAQLEGVVHDQDAAAGERQAQGIGVKGEAVRARRLLDRFALVVVAEHADQRCLERGEGVDRLAAGHVAGVDHALDARRVEQLDDPLDVGQAVVGVADDADAHGGKTRRGRPTGAPPSLRTRVRPGRYAAFSRMWIAQALPRPITWVMPNFAPWTWRLPASPRRWVDTS